MARSKKEEASQESRQGAASLKVLLHLRIGLSYKKYTNNRPFWVNFGRHRRAAGSIAVYSDPQLLVGSKNVYHLRSTSACTASEVDN